jgi:hypothetical protein
MDPKRIDSKKDKLSFRTKAILWTVWTAVMVWGSWSLYMFYDLMTPLVVFTT